MTYNLIGRVSWRDIDSIPPSGLIDPLFKFIMMIRQAHASGSWMRRGENNRIGGGNANCYFVMTLSLTSK